MKVGKLLLYHGSDQQIDRPEWNHGSRYRDFGQCFYTTHSRAMASNWAEKNFMLHPVVNGYALDFFADVAPLIKYDRYKEMQVCFSSEYAVKLLKRIDL